MVRDPDFLAGKIFTDDEIEELISIIKSSPGLYVVFDRRVGFLIEREQDRFASDPDVFKKSLYLYSAGRMFNTEDWSIGWTIGSKELLRYIPVYDQWIRFNPNTPGMVAYRKLFERCEPEAIASIIKDQKSKLRTLYDKFAKEVKELDKDLEVVETELSYYPLVNVEKMLNKLPASKIESVTDSKGNQNLRQAAVLHLNELIGEPRFQTMSDEATGDYLVVYKAFS